MDSFQEGVVVQGWIEGSPHRLGQQKYILHISDHLSSRTIQAIVPKSLCEGISLNAGTAIQLRGNWIPSFGPQQPYELQATECLLVGLNETQTISKNVLCDNEFLRRNAHLRAKSRHYAALLRLRSRVLTLTHRYFSEEKGFIHYDVPIISRNDCEGAGEVFEIKTSNCKEFFDDGQQTSSNTYLPVSSQLYLEAAASGIPQVYTIMPAFRADISVTSQHLAELKMLEVECAFEQKLSNLFQLIEDYLKFLVQNIRDHYGDDTEEASPLFQSEDASTGLKPLLLQFRTPIPQITYAEAAELLTVLSNRQQKSSSGIDPQQLIPKCTGTFNKQQEFALVREFAGPVFVTDFPANKRPFYMRRSKDGLTALCFDLLTPFVGELAGGSVREWVADLVSWRLPPGSARPVAELPHHSKQNKSSGDNKNCTAIFSSSDPSLSHSSSTTKSGSKDIKHHKQQSESEDPDPVLQWYVDLRRSGYPRSSGFGIGMDRLVQTLFGIANIRDAVPFPRWYKHCKY